MANTWTMETIKVEGTQLLHLVKQLLHEGNVRRIIVKQGDQTIVEMPLTIGVAGAAISPVLAVAGVLAALLTDCTIDVERLQNSDGATKLPPTADQSTQDSRGEPMSSREVATKL